MTNHTYTAEDFEQDRFAEHRDGRLANRLYDVEAGDE